MNAPMQGNGAEMMRLATVFGLRAGVQICTPVHDAFLIEAPLEEIDVAVETMRAAMDRAASAVLAGPTIGTDVAITRYPDTYQDQRPEAVYMRNLVADTLRAMGVASDPTPSTGTTHSFHSDNIPRPTGRPGAVNSMLFSLESFK
jgi:hypothetical protein